MDIDEQTWKEAWEYINPIIDEASERCREQPNYNNPLRMSRKELVSAKERSEGAATILLNARADYVGKMHSTISKHWAELFKLCNIGNPAFKQYLAEAYLHMKKKQKEYAEQPDRAEALG